MALCADRVATGMSSKKEDSSQNNNEAGAAVEEVVDVLSDNKGSDWKKALSGALDEERLLCALVVLCIFYVGLTLANAYHENHDKDEDAIIEKCACRYEHRAFYIAWSIICYALWFVCHSGVLLHNNPSSSGKLKKLLKCLLCIRKNNAELVHWNWKWKCCWCIECCCCNKPQYDVTSGKANYKNQYTMIDHYKYHLWTQYYELYVVGITKNSERFEVNKLDKIVFSNKNPVKKQSTKEHEKVTKDNGSIQTHDEASLLPNMEVQPDAETNTSKASVKETTAVTALPRETKQTCLYWIQTMMYYILGLIRYVAQLAVVPLLMIQIFDTYAYLCFTADNYCNMSSQYKLHLDQTAMTFAFYCSLMVSLLSTTMLRWFPYPIKSKPAQNKEDLSTIPTSPSDHNAGRSLNQMYQGNINFDENFELKVLFEQPRSPTIMSTHFTGTS